MRVVESEPTAAVVRHLAGRWGLPLLADPMRPDDEALEPEAVIRIVLRAHDARLTMALALWLSLVAPGIRLEGDWSEEDRRRVAYLCELATCLERLRNPLSASRGPGWALHVVGLQPRR